MSSSTAIVTGVDFVTVPTRDLERAVEFYGTTLGLPRSVYMPERNFAEFETGNLTLSVVMPDKMGFEYRPSVNPISLHVEDVAAARSELEARGGEVGGAIFDTGVRRMGVFAHPDRN